MIPWTYLQNEYRLTDLDNKFMVTSGKDGGRDSQGVWDGHGHTAVFNTENQLHSPGNSGQCYATT